MRAPVHVCMCALYASTQDVFTHCFADRMKKSSLEFARVRFGSAALADPLGDPKDLMIRSFLIDLSRTLVRVDLARLAAPQGCCDGLNTLRGAPSQHSLA